MRRLFSRKRLLLLDDDPSMQRLISTILNRAGYRVDTVSSGSQAIEKIAQRDYDALLLDIMTPTDGGMTVIRHLKDAKPGTLAKIVLVTASPDTVLRTVENEVYAVVRKPFEHQTLVDTINRLVGK